MVTRDKIRSPKRARELNTTAEIVRKEDTGMVLVDKFGAKARRALPAKAQALKNTADIVRAETGADLLVKEASKPTDKTHIVIEPLSMYAFRVKITGIAPYVQHNFAQKKRLQMEEKQRAGSQGSNKKIRSPRNFTQDYEDAKHFSKEGWVGIPAPALRNAMISACRLVGFHMSKAKLSIFIVPDGLDRDDGTPLVRIIGNPRPHKMIARNETGVADIRWRPMWEFWGAEFVVEFDEAQFSCQDVFNLLVRAGSQVGIGEGRPDSKNSNGLGWGRWKVELG